MRLSEAMRLGAMLKPQGFGVAPRRHVSACALEAVAEAAGVKTIAGLTVDYIALESIFPILGKRVDCPCGKDCGSLNTSLTAAIYGLNDRHRWTREAIADWVEGIENAQASNDGTPVVAVCPQDEPQTNSVRA